MGMLFALVALGLAIIFGVMNIVNFAHGEFALTGAYLAFFFSVNLGFNLLVAAIFAVILTSPYLICKFWIIINIFIETPNIVIKLSTNPSTNE